MVGLNLTIENCQNEGKIKGGLYTAGIIASNKSNLTIENCINEGYINGKSHTGGCIGRGGSDAIIDVRINNFINTGDIQGEENGGGIIGYSSINDVVIISNSYNTGDITSTSREAGGMIGDTDSQTYLVNVYNTGNCTGYRVNSNGINGSSGGIIGSSYNINSKNVIINAYNKGNITSNSNASGILGAKDKEFENLKIENVYNIGNLDGNEKNNGIAYFSHITKLPSSSSIKNAYYKNNAPTGTNLSTEDNSEAKSEEYMKTQEFVDKLNTYVQKNLEYKIDNKTTIKLNEWKLSTEGYPIFKK